MQTRRGWGEEGGGSVGQLASWSYENYQFWSMLVKIKLEWGSNFWNWELKLGLKLDSILEPELNLHGSKTKTTAMDASQRAYSHFINVLAQGA